MDDAGIKLMWGGEFLTKYIDCQDVFTPEDFTNEHKDIAKAIEDFIKGEITSRGDEIEVLNNELSRELMAKAGELIWKKWKKTDC